MNDLQLAFESAANYTSGEIVGALLLALVLGIMVALVYRFSNGSKTVSPALVGTLIILPMIGGSVMMIIGNNLARAFSLVGALAIIRFRTPLRSPWDITFVFLSLTVGIAAGVMAWRVATLATFIICLSVMALHVLPVTGMRRPVLVLRCDAAAHEGIEAALTAIIDRHTRSKSLTEARSVRFGETISYRYHVILRADADFDPLVRALSDQEGVERVVLTTEEELTDA